MVLAKYKAGGGFFREPITVVGLPLFSLTVLLSACAAPTTSANSQDNLAAQWTSAGFSSTEVYEWQNDGVTDPTSAQKWMSLDPACRILASYCQVGENSQYIPPTWIGTLLNAGMSVDEATPYLESAKVYHGYTTDYSSVVLSARDLHRNYGLSIPRAVYFAARNIPYSQINSFVAQKTAYDQKKEQIAEQCSGAISSSEIRELSPFALGDSRNCFQTEDGLTGLQWMNPSTALMVDDLSITPVTRTPEPVELLVDFSPDQQQLNHIEGVIIRGEGEYSFMNQSGSEITVPRVRVLMYIDENLEGDPPPN